MSFRSLAACLLLPSALALGCGEDGKSLGNACPELPLYDIARLGEPDSGERLTEAEQEAIRKASSLDRSATGHEGRCTTPLGTALTDPGNATGRTPSTGGTGPGGTGAGGARDGG